MSTKKRDRWASDSDDESAKPSKPSKSKEGKSKKKGGTEAAAPVTAPVTRVSTMDPLAGAKPLHIPLLHGCRSVEVYERLNHIDEGTYGVVFRARDKETGEICAVKQVVLMSPIRVLDFLVPLPCLFIIPGKIEQHCDH
jgi:cell division cycle 2-like